ncbi:MAG: hypothetical protein ICV66_03680, partial [Chitinophagaceae bacterium]|nr:hypothetical protein [Chitinophagaceae bacterium]
FEVKYNEYRTFFTEGTELFNKGNLFYSRRIGSTPIHYGDVNGQLLQDEHILKNPQEAKLINATKISGRTKKGLGIGFFNAVTKPMYAEVEDEAKQKRKIQTNPLTNYNIVVFDQTLKNNSSVSFINTNVLRSGADYDANVSAALVNFNNKKNTYNWNGKVSVSHLSDRPQGNTTGYSHLLSFSKSGNWSYNLTQELVDDKYDKNDMGILFNNNYLDHYFWTAYRWLKPKNWYNRIQVNYNATYSRRFKESNFQHFRTNVNANIQMKNLWWAGVFVGRNAKGNDFYEPREPGRKFRSPSSWRFNMWLESNSAKKYSFGGNLFMALYEPTNGRSYEIAFYNKYRFSDKFSLTQETMFSPAYNDVGFYNKVNNPANGGQQDIVFSTRNRSTVENVLNAKYNFNNRSGITFRTRHYWSKVRQRELFDLQQDGNLVKTTHSNLEITHRNFNAFTIDAVYTLQFAPGSFINLVWKNSIYTSDGKVEYPYFKNFDRTISSPQNNSLSLKVLYFLDYLDFKKWRKRN